MTSYELTHFNVVRVWKTKSLLFSLRYDPLIVFRRQNLKTFIFIKMMSHDLLVQMAYQWTTDYIWCHLQSVPCNVDHSIFLIKNSMCNVSCEKALPLGRAKREARERASESGWREEPFMVNTISCGTFAVTVFTLCGVPRFPGGIENLWVIVASSPFSPSPPAPAFRFRVSSRASIFHDIPNWRACLQAKCNVQTHTI